MSETKLNLTPLINEIRTDSIKSKNIRKTDDVGSCGLRSIFADISFRCHTQNSLFSEEVLNGEHAIVIPGLYSTNSQGAMPPLSSWAFKSAIEQFNEIENTRNRTTCVSVQSKPNLLTRAIRIAFVN